MPKFPSKACEHKKRRKQLLTLELDPKISYKELTKTAHKNQIFPKKTENKIITKKYEKKKLFKKNLKQLIFQRPKIYNHPTHATFSYTIIKKLQKRFPSGHTHQTLPKTHTILPWNSTPPKKKTHPT